LQDENCFLQVEAAGALGKIGPPAAAAVPALIQVIQDDRLAEAAEALGRIGPPATAVPALLSAIQLGGTLGATAAEALRRLESERP
jgi:HEAT repeat protein